MCLFQVKIHSTYTSCKLLIVSSMYIYKKNNTKAEGILISVLKHSITSKASVMINCICILCIGVRRHIMWGEMKQVLGACVSLFSSINIHCLSYGFFGGDSAISATDGPVLDSYSYIKILENLHAFHAQPFAL